MISNVETAEVEVLESPVQAAAVAPELVLTTWSLDSAHSSAAFSVRHMMITNVKGDFRELSGTLTLDRDHIEQSSINVTINPASIETHEPGRDTHLKSADFFDVEKFPEITFVSSKWAHKSDDELAVTGNLTMHGVTKEVVLTVEGPTGEVVDPYGQRKIGFSATTKLNHEDFGLGFNAILEGGGVVVGKEVKISIDASFVKK